MYDSFKSSEVLQVLDSNYICFRTVGHISQWNETPQYVSRLNCWNSASYHPSIIKSCISVCRYVSTILANNKNISLELLFEDIDHFPRVHLSWYCRLCHSCVEEKIRKMGRQLRHRPCHHLARLITTTMAIYSSPSQISAVYDFSGCFI